MSKPAGSGGRPGAAFTITGATRPSRRAEPKIRVPAKAGTHPSAASNTVKWVPGFRRDCGVRASGGGAWRRLWGPRAAASPPGARGGGLRASRPGSRHRRFRLRRLHARGAILPGAGGSCRNHRRRGGAGSPSGVSNPFVQPCRPVGEHLSPNRALASNPSPRRRCRRSPGAVEWPDLPRTPEMDVAFLTIAELSRAYRSREVSPVEVTKALLARIAVHDGSLHSFLRLTEEVALCEAKTAERELMAGQARGPLHGVPYALKDIVETAGIATTGHSKLRQDYGRGAGQAAQGGRRDHDGQARDLG